MGKNGGGDGALVPQSKQRVFGDYEILSRIGKGAVGEVFKAKALSGEHAGRHVCLKLLGREYLAVPENNAVRKRAVGTLTNEVEIARMLVHPNIARLLDHGVCNGVSFVAFELVEGSNLAAIFSDRRLLTNQVGIIGIQVARALAAAHQLDVLHRDVKPGNIMIGRDGQVKLVDFGLAKLRTAQTSGFSYVGTPPYWAPEQIKREVLSPATDVYALGVVLVEGFLGRPLFESQGLEERRVDVQQLGVPPVLAPVLARSLDFEPGERYQSAGSFADELAAALMRYDSASQLGEIARSAALRPRLNIPLALSVYVDPFEPSAGGEEPVTLVFEECSDGHSARTSESAHGAGEKSSIPMGELRRLAQVVVADGRDADTTTGVPSLEEPSLVERADARGTHWNEQGESYLSEGDGVSPEPADIRWDDSGLEAAHVRDDEVGALAIVGEGPVREALSSYARVMPAAGAWKILKSTYWGRWLGGVAVLGLVVVGGLVVWGWRAGLPVPASEPHVDVLHRDGATPSKQRARLSEHSEPSDLSSIALLATAAAPENAGVPHDLRTGLQPESGERSVPGGTGAARKGAGTEVLPTATLPVRRPATRLAVVPKTRVKVTVIPEGSVRVDGKKLGRAPLRIELERGEHRIVARLNKRIRTRDVFISGSTQLVVFNFYDEE